MQSIPNKLYSTDSLSQASGSSIIPDHLPIKDIGPQRKSGFSFFSIQGLAQDILELTQAEVDIPFQAYMTLDTLLTSHIQQNQTLRDKWLSCIGTITKKGILHSPEHLLGDQEVFELPKKVSQREDKVFNRFEEVIQGINILRQEITSSSSIKDKDQIFSLLEQVQTFYQDYKSRVIALCNRINEKKVLSLDIEEDLAGLLNLLKPKAIMFGELFPEGTAYRIPRQIARHILSLDDHGSLKPKNDSQSANHRVNFLPYSDRQGDEAVPRVFFKANSNPPIQPGKEAMLFSLYRLLNIPVPRTGLLVLTRLNENDPSFYTVQASEAVIGESPNQASSFQDNLEPGTVEYEHFCYQALGAILTNPSDGKPANFIYHLIKYGLVSIDNDEIFYNSIHPAKNNDFYVETKSFLFTIQVMDKPLSKSIYTYMTTLDPKLLLIAWLEELSEKNQEYESLKIPLQVENARQLLQRALPYGEYFTIAKLKEAPIYWYPPTEDIFESLSLPISLNHTLVTSLEKKLAIIIKALRNNQLATPQMLLDETSALLGSYYKNLRKKFPSPLKAIAAVFGADKTEGDYSLLSSLVDLSLMAPFLKTEIDANAALPNHSPTELCTILYQKFKEENPYPIDNLFQRHGERRKKGCLKPEDVVREINLILKSEVANIQDIPNLVDFWYKGRNEIKEQQLLENWDSAFRSIPNPELKWLLTIESHFLRGWKESQSEYPEGILDSVISQIISEIK